jgi:hypothetical protein
MQVGAGVASFVAGTETLQGSCSAFEVVRLQLKIFTSAPIQTTESDLMTSAIELDLQKVKGRPLSLAIRGWILWLGLGLAAAAVLHSLPGIQAPMMVGLVLTTTALGTFMPILRP